MICYLFPETSYFFFSDSVPKLLYYAHIPTIVISLLLGFYVYWKGRDQLLNRIFFAILLMVSMWATVNIITWTNIHSDIVLFFWSFFSLILGLIAILCIYFVYVFLEKKDITPKLKFIFFTLLAPVILLAPTSFNIKGFNITDCDAFKFEWLPFKLYYSFLGVVAMIWILILLIRKYRVSMPDFRKQIILMGVGIESFMFIFFIMIFLASYFTQIGVLQDSSLEMYGMFGMVIFTFFMTVLIVRFQTFHVRLFGAQALVIGLVILIGSKLFTAEVGASRTITFVTLGFVSFFGYFLIKSVKKEIETRERIQRLADELEIASHTLHEANEGQKNLIHIMNHQIKGYLAVGRNIFAELATGDYGQVAEEAKPLLTKGFDEMTDGVEYVQSVLRGESAKSGTLPFDMKPMNLKPVIEGLISKQKDVAEKKGLSFESTVADGKYTIIGDALQLDEAFKNLFTNAIKYNTPNGSIKVTLSETDGKILFTIKDTGIGISEEDQKNLFKPGGMGKNSIKYNTDAAGYGLAFVKPVIEAHKDGKIWYETEVGKGTTFFVELPVEPVHV